MITHLISTTEFVKVLQQSQLWGNCYDVVCNILEKYANFISQKPELWMFVPCDEDGNVLEEPENYKEWLLDTPYDFLYKYEHCLQYQQAQSKVLFKGWEYKNNALWYNNKHVIPMYDFEDYYTLERLQYDKGILELTEEALKQIGL